MQRDDDDDVKKRSMGINPLALLNSRMAVPPQYAKSLSGIPDSPENIVIVDGKIVAGTPDKLLEKLIDDSVTGKCPFSSHPPYNYMSFAKSHTYTLMQI